MADLWKLALTSLAMLALTGCREDSIASFSDPDVFWLLSDVNGTAFTGEAGLSFPEKGRIEGRGPCNGFAGKVDAIYPWFEVMEMAATERDCADLNAERVFFDALHAATLAEISGSVMILSNEEGLEMVFRGQ